MYLLRLDDASEYMNIENWIRIKEITDRYGVKPIYGIIPNNQDPDLLRYNNVKCFWKLMKNWKDDGWVPALHGYTHVFETKEGGINPVNGKSEFAGLTIEKQRDKIRKGFQTLKRYDLEPTIFFAPAHTFDLNTLKVLYEETSIRIISDTIARNIYYKEPFYFIPNQCGHARKLPFNIVTFCYHPNIMCDEDFIKLDRFLKTNGQYFTTYSEKMLIKRKKDILDRLLEMLYFGKRKLLN